MKISLLALVLFSSLVFSSCAPFYIPNAPMVFNHEEQGDATINFRQGTYSSNLQAGYAITDNVNVGLIANSLYTGEATVAGNVYDGTDAKEINLVGGYYNKISATNIFELNVGIGAVKMNYPQNISNYYNGFLQPTLTFASLNNHTKLSVAPRLKGLVFGRFDGTKDTAVYQGFIEPILSLSTGERIHFLVQAGFSARLQQELIYDYSPFIFNIGVGYTFKPKKTDIIEPSASF